MGGNGLSKFVPLMRTTYVGSATQDNVTFESSHYFMIANVGRGFENKMKATAAK